MYISSSIGHGYNILVPIFSNCHPYRKEERILLLSIEAQLLDVIG